MGPGGGRRGRRRRKVQDVRDCWLLCCCSAAVWLREGRDRGEGWSRVGGGSEGARDGWREGAGERGSEGVREGGSHLEVRVYIVLRRPDLQCSSASGVSSGWLD
jgi:hypothetical protein